MDTIDWSFLSFVMEGEICLCLERIYVHNDIFDDFLSKFVAATERERVGDPSHPFVTIGPLISRAHLTRVVSVVEQARQEGGLIHTGGHGLTGEEEDFHHELLPLNSKSVKTLLQMLGVFSNAFRVSA